MEPEKLDAATAAALGEGDEDDDVQGSQEPIQAAVETASPPHANDDFITTESDIVEGDAAVAGEGDAPAAQEAATEATAAPISAGPVVGVVRLFGMPIEVSDKEISDFLQLGNLPPSRIMQICGLR